MPFRICKSFEIESGHILSKHAGNCRFPHGHSRRIEVVVTADVLDAHDMVCDFKALKSALSDFLNTWDHALCLNTNDPEFAYFQKTYGARIIPFTGRDPTSEVMAQTIFRELRRQLASMPLAEGVDQRISATIRVESVRVSETSSSWAEFYER